MLKKIKLWLSVFPLIVFNNFNSIPAKATSNDAITLESIRAISTTVLTGENIVMQLEVAVPTGYSWDPNVSALGGKISILMCPTSRYSEVSGIGSCSFSGTSSTVYTLTNIGSVSSSTIGSFDIKTFNISGTLNAGEINTFKLFRVRIPAGNIPDRSELHTYLRGQNFAQELGSDRTDIAVPTFLNGDLSVVASLPTPTPTPTVSATPSPSASASETPTPTPTPSVTETSTPTFSSGTSSVVTQVINSILQPIGIQASGQSIKKIPNRNGDLTWQKSREILTINEEWSVRKNKNASGGSFVSTSINESKLQLTTRGDAFTLRFMTGKKMGKIQVNVDGKKLAVINTGSTSTKSKAKSWIGIGTGNHKIEIIPILDPGQIIGIDAYQVARAV
jgi:hypothetical protein